MINIILADHQRIYRIGMASALAAEDDLRIVGQPHSLPQLLHGLKKFRTHVLILSAAYLGRLAEIKAVCQGQQTAILLLEEPGDVVFSQFSPDVQGVIQRSVDQATVVRCIRHVARGGRILRSVIDQPIECREDSVGFRVGQRLSQLDLNIIALLLQGLKNREIAAQLGSTEQRIKNSLRKIFDKTGVSDRLELALFVLHHRLMDGFMPKAHLIPTLTQSLAMRSIRDVNYRSTVH